ADKTDARGSAPRLSAFYFRRENSFVRAVSHLDFVLFGKTLDSIQHLGGCGEALLRAPRHHQEDGCFKGCRNSALELTRPLHFAFPNASDDVARGSAGER